MFVKILSFHYSDNSPSENVYECDCYNLVPYQDINTQFSLTLHKNNQVLSEWVIDRYENAIYFVNNDGKTIDSLHRLSKADQSK